ncbi:YafY family transcriptional regulator [Brevibacillus sp. SYP-B805]|uniref:helix-turn-helix transcriptional regulator n=1 Tax=Brevibacillus sp. SYP-B805 TaxID=1578199 RepID=UPI0013EA4304|nr:YafY family protein [Brevibacillus sp. SYP-B805]NGQ94098.1 YafY family transcriptional regulator [Brevibacillus sp. SYP-B805]
MRADRLISILMILQTEGRITARELARRLEVSERTIYRDIDALSASGIPIYADAGVGGGFSLPPDYRTKLDGLTTPEIHALFLHLTDQPFPQLGIGQSLRTAMLKLLNALPHQHRQDVEWIRNRVYLDTGAWGPHKEQAAFIQEAQQAIWEEKQAVMTYTTRRGREMVQTIKPYGLVAKAGIWFLVGEAGNRPQAFRLSRIRSFRIMKERFRRPAAFDLPSFWQEWVARMESQRVRYPVVLEIAREGLPLLSQVMGEAVRQQAEQQQTSLRPGWMRVSLSFESEEVARCLILALGLQAEVIQPTELRQRIRDQAAEVMRLYS